MAGMRQTRSDVREVMSAYPPGARLLREKDSKVYQIGAKHGAAAFWLFCETDASKGTVDAAVILRDFKRVDA